MKYSKMMILLFVLLVPATAHATLEPSGSVQIATCNFNSSPPCGAGSVRAGAWYNLYPGSEIIGSDSGEPLSPPGFLDNVLNYTGPCGPSPGFLQCANGGTQIGYIDNKADRELYARLSFKISLGYGCSRVGFSKVFFMRDIDNTLGYIGTNGVFGIRGCDNPKSLIFGHNTGGGLDNSHICATDLGLTCFANVGSGAIYEGQWHTIEACIRSSSTTTARDGYVWWAVDGVMAGNYPGLNYGNGNVNEWVENQTWDGYGNGQGFTQTIRQQIGHVYVSVPPNGGCASVAGGGGTTPPPVDTTPPGRASGLVITQLN